MTDQTVISLLEDYAAELRQKEAVASKRVLPTSEPYASCALEERLEDVREAIEWLKRKGGRGAGKTPYVHAQAG